MLNRKVIKVFYHITKKLQVKITGDSKKIAVTERAEGGEKARPFPRKWPGRLTAEKDQNGEDFQTPDNHTQ